MNETLNCSFCGQTKSETDDGLRGIHNGFICFACIEQGTFANENSDASACCDFCGMQRLDATKLMSGNNVNICGICIEIMRQPPSILLRSGFIISPASRLGNWLLTTENRFVRKYIVGERT